MGSLANRRSVMTLFSDKLSIESHQVRFVLAEKGVNVEIHDVSNEQLPEDLVTLNPYGSLPTLVDRELVLYHAPVIIEYIDERFPHPPLMPVYPVAKAKSRLMMYRLYEDWFSLVPTIDAGGEKSKAAVRTLVENLIMVSPAFSQLNYFMSDDFSMVDCYVAPLLWRLEKWGITLKTASAKPIVQYMNRLFEREAFIASLTDAEREMRAL